MKLKKENQQKTKADENDKKIKKNKNGISKEEIENSGGNLKKVKNNIQKQTSPVGTEKVKSKKKIKQAIESSEAIKDAKMKKLEKAESLAKIKNPTNESKKGKENSALKSSMSSSELLLKLNSVSADKTDSKEKKTVEENNENNVKIDTKKKSSSEKMSKKSKDNIDSKEKKSLEENNAKIDTKKSQKSSLEKMSKKSKDKNNPEKKKIKFGKVTKVKKVKDKNEKTKLKLSQSVGPSLAEAPKFDLENFNAILNEENIKKSVKALKKLVKKETEEMKNAIFKDYRYIINFCLFKIPSAPKRHVKLNIKNSLVGPDDDVLFIVKDLQRGLKVDYEPTVHHYEDILREKGIEGIKAIMPFNQLKKEYNSYEMKRKLANLYDYFICDGRIAGHIFGFLGNAFSSKQRCTIFSVRTENLNHLKKEIHVALHKTSFRQGSKGDNISIIVGNHNNSSEQVTENILEILKQLKEKLPGSYPNIRNVTLKVNIKGTSSVPLYINMGKPLKGTPYIIGLKEQKLNKMKEKAEGILNKFAITNDGHVQKLTPEEIETRKRKLQENNEEKTKKSKKSKKAKSEKSKEDLNGKSKDIKKKKGKVESEQNDSDSENDPDYEPAEINEDDNTENDDSDVDDSDVADNDALDSD
ncbi:ribosomal L1 domain-containing protein CG13096-like [Condylostylus longicornis]|uniref:ribosomal L1 domain-containing protein CG13096-like n=1 Tax=Condylostylus longicornis TaxID=2530218 RepID=UPI00244DEEA3|nr:ribosomal L1 domain-containing protein CG13096-like [Condylostylus longicornis]